MEQFDWLENKRLSQQPIKRALCVTPFDLRLCGEFQNPKFQKLQWLTVRGQISERNSAYLSQLVFFLHRWCKNSTMRDWWIDLVKIGPAICLFTRSKCPLDSLFRSANESWTWERTDKWLTKCKRLRLPVYKGQFWTGKNQELSLLCRSSFRTLFISLGFSVWSTKSWLVFRSCCCEKKESREF